MEFYNEKSEKKSAALHNHVKNDKRDMNGGKIELTHITWTTWALWCTQVHIWLGNLLNNNRDARVNAFLLKFLISC